MGKKRPLNQNLGQRDFLGPFSFRQLLLSIGLCIKEVNVGWYDMLVPCLSPLVKQCQGYSQLIREVPSYLVPAYLFSLVSQHFFFFCIFYVSAIQNGFELPKMLFSLTFVSLHTLFLYLECLTLWSFLACERLLIFRVSASASSGDLYRLSL